MHDRHPDDGKVTSVRANGRRRVMTINLSPSETKQSDVYQSEIKELLRKYEQTGLLPVLQQADLDFRDITSFTDYADAMRHAATAKGEFMALDARIRRVFDHDHLKWLDAAHDGLDPDQISRLERLGLATKVQTEGPAAPDPQAVPATASPTDSST